MSIPDAALWLVYAVLSSLAALARRVACDVRTARFACRRPHAFGVPFGSNQRALCVRFP